MLYLTIIIYKLNYRIFYVNYTIYFIYIINWRRCC